MDDFAPVLPPARDSRVKFTAFDVGARGTFVYNSSLDPYAQRDGIAQVSLGISQTLWVSGLNTLALGFRFDGGGTGGFARGASTDLRVERYGLSLEGRRHFARWGYAFLRLVPGAVHAKATVNLTGGGSAKPTAESWLVGAELSTGTSWLIWPRENGPRRVVRMWITPEVGYSFASEGRSELRGEDEPREDRFVSVHVPALSLHGPFLRLAATLSF